MRTTLTLVVALLFAVANSSAFSIRYGPPSSTDTMAIYGEMTPNASVTCGSANKDTAANLIAANYFAATQTDREGYRHNGVINCDLTIDTATTKFVENYGANLTLSVPDANATSPGEMAGALNYVALVPDHGGIARWASRPADRGVAVSDGFPSAPTYHRQE